MYCLCGNELPDFPLKCLCESDLCVDCALDRGGVCVICSDFFSVDERSLEPAGLNREIDPSEFVDVMPQARVCVDCNITLPDSDHITFRCRLCGDDLCDIHPDKACRKCRLQPSYKEDVRCFICGKSKAHAILSNIADPDEPYKYACRNHVRKCPNKHWMSELTQCSYQACLNFSCPVEGCGKFNGALFCPNHTRKCLCGNSLPVSGPSIRISNTSRFDGINNRVCNQCYKYYNNVVRGILLYKMRNYIDLPRDVINIIMYYALKN